MRDPYFSMVCKDGKSAEMALGCLGCKRPWVRIPPSRLLESRIYGRRRCARFVLGPHLGPHSIRFFDRFSAQKFSFCIWSHSKFGLLRTWLSNDERERKRVLLSWISGKDSD